MELLSFSCCYQTENQFVHLQTNNKKKSRNRVNLNFILRFFDKYKLKIGKIIEFAIFKTKNNWLSIKNYGNL